MITSNKYILNLIEKQFAGNISYEELSLLKEWYNESPITKEQYKEYYAFLKYIRINRNQAEFEPYTAEAYQTFLHTTRKSKKLSNYHFLGKGWIKYAAVFVLAFGLGALSLNLLQTQGSGRGLAQTIEIPFGSKSHITLPDGTSVWLNSGSRLSYNESFGTKDRNVTIDGEGYFDVVKNKKLPFQVYSGNVKIEVLGTKFNFKSYEEDENSRVTLVEGSLNVADINDESRKVLLSPDQQAVINKNEDRFVVKNVDARSYALWTQPKPETILIHNGGVNEIAADVRTPNVTLRNTLFFDEEPFRQILRDLERAFNVKIEIKDSTLLDERFYADFRNEETLMEILEIMAENANLKYTIENEEIIIARK